MADYDSILIKAVHALQPNTAKARQALYQRARSAMASEMGGAFPPFHGSQIVEAKQALETAIQRVEAVAARRYAAAAPRRGAAVAPQAGRLGESGVSLRKRWTDTIFRAAVSRSVPPDRDPWLSELLTRASDGADNDELDFAPMRYRGGSR